MANSSRINTPPRCFLIKVSPDAAPAQIGTPNHADQWEGGYFRTDHPRQRISRQGSAPIKLSAEQKEDPRANDQLYIWINEKHRGRGLTATAVVADVLLADSKLQIQVTNVRLYNPIGVINNNLLMNLMQDHNVFDDIKNSARSELRYLKHQWIEEIDAATDSESIEAGRQARMRLIEQRANQGPFRDAVVARDQARCVVTGCRVVEILEAAHLIPYASGHPDRDDPGNGILLRADIHLLFDRNLMAIDPQTMRVWVSDRLRGSTYARFSRKEVRTAASFECLDYQYEAAAGVRTRH